MNRDKTCANCAHYNGAAIPSIGLCMATLERTFKTTRCFNRKFKPGTSAMTETTDMKGCRGEYKAGLVKIFAKECPGREYCQRYIDWLLAGKPKDTPLGPWEDHACRGFIRLRGDNHEMANK